MTGLIPEPELRRRFIDGMHGLRLGPPHAMQRLLDYLRAEQRLGRLPDAVDADAVNTLLVGATALLALTGLVSHAGAPAGASRGSSRPSLRP